MCGVLLLGVCVGFADAVVVVGGCGGGCGVIDVVVDDVEVCVGRHVVVVVGVVVAGVVVVSVVCVDVVAVVVLLLLSLLLVACCWCLCCYGWCY